jgi:hypothetical protein
VKDRADAQHQNLHRNNLAEWVLLIGLFPAWLAVVAWNKVRRFVFFVASWFKS